MISVEEQLSEITAFLEKPFNEKDNIQLGFSPDSLPAIYAIAHELYKNGKFEDAMHCFRFLTLNDSFERKYWMGLAAAYQMLKCYPEAIECYSAAALQDFTDPYVHCHAADCFFYMGNLPKAREALNSAIITAQDQEIHSALIPRLKLLKDVWSKLPNGGSNE